MRNLNLFKKGGRIKIPPRCSFNQLAVMYIPFLPPVYLTMKSISFFSRQHINTAHSFNKKKKRSTWKGSPVFVKKYPGSDPVENNEKHMSNLKAGMC